jgi:hypothetical protein
MRPRVGFHNTGAGFSNAATSRPTSTVECRVTCGTTGKVDLIPTGEAVILVLEQWSYSTYEALLSSLLCERQVLPSLSNYDRLTVAINGAHEI